MKNFEAISASLYPYDVDPFLKEKACIDEGIDTQADYTVKSIRFICEIYD